MENTVVNELNALLKGEHMAVEAYERFIQDVKDNNVKKEFQKFQKDHKQHTIEISERIQNLGGKPVASAGIAGVMYNTTAAIKSLRGVKTDEVLKEAYDGEDKGIGMVEEIIKGDLDSQSKAMVEKILSTDHDHLKRMKDMISGFEGTH